VQKNSVRKDEEPVGPVLAQGGENAIEVFGFLDIQLL